MRRTSAQIDADIVETAARIFAVQGVERTSLQQVADATGYSKTGLLHRFGSKDGLLGAVVAASAVAVEALLAELDALPAGPGRMRSVYAVVTREALAHPGLVQLLMSGKQPHELGAAAGVEALELPAALAPLVEPVRRFEQILRTAEGEPESVLRHRLAVLLVVQAVVHAHVEPAAALGARLAPLVTDLAVAVAGPD